VLKNIVSSSFSRFKSFITQDPKFILLSYSILKFRCSIRIRTSLRMCFGTLKIVGSWYSHAFASSATWPPLQIDSLIHSFGVHTDLITANVRSSHSLSQIMHNFLIGVETAGKSNILQFSLNSRSSRFCLVKCAKKNSPSLLFVFVAIEAS